MDVYFAYDIKCKEEILLGLLTQFDFESFEEHDENIIGYIKKTNLSEEIKEAIVHTIKTFTQDYRITEIEPQNWNEIWETSFQPVIVEDFCQIRADFHPPVTDIPYDLVINPKMAFGTGHHATTYMMVKLMSGIDFKGKNVFDFGCGTGILAILASKLGASHIDAIDIEKESYLNTIENCDVNTVFNVSALYGDLTDAPDTKYDIILANINRNILVKYATPLVQKLKPNGIILFSGVLFDDKEAVIDEYNTLGMNIQSTITMDGWICAILKLKA